METTLNASQLITMTVITWGLLVFLLAVLTFIAVQGVSLVVIEKRKERREIRRFDLLDHFSQTQDRMRGTLVELVGKVQHMEKHCPRTLGDEEKASE